MKKRFAPNKIGRLRPPEQARESEKSPSGQREGDDEAADSPDEGNQYLAGYPDIKTTPLSLPKLNW